MARTRDQKPEVITPLDSLIFIPLLRPPDSRPPSSESTPVAWQLLRSRLTSANNGETLISCDWARRTAATKATNGIARRRRRRGRRGSRMRWSSLIFSLADPSSRRYSLVRAFEFSPQREKEEREREREGCAF